MSQRCKRVWFALSARFDEPDAFSSLWDELNASDPTQPCPQSTDPSTEPHTLQQQEGEDDEVQDGEEAVDQDGQRLSQEWDGTAEPPVEALCYTVEWKAVLKTKRLGMNTAEDVLLSLKAFWDATLKHSLDASLEREFSQQNRPEPCSTLVVVCFGLGATRRMRHQQALQQGAEEHASGEAAHWRAVYRTMRCPGRPCKNNQGYC
jgi:hypothetical protein